jgi:hypothetical protein
VRREVHAYPDPLVDHAEHRLQLTRIGVSERAEDGARKHA